MRQKEERYGIGISHRTDTPFSADMDVLCLKLTVGVVCVLLVDARGLPVVARARAKRHGLVVDGRRQRVHHIRLTGERGTPRTG